MQSIRPNRKAFALSIVLWIVAALLFGIATISIFSKDTLFLTKGVDSKLRAQLLADDVLETLKFYILTANYDSVSFINKNLENFKYRFPQRIILDDRLYKIGDDIEIRVLDTSAMVNVLTASAKFISNLAVSKRKTQQRLTIKDSIDDWRDKDNFVSLNGAENSRYKLSRGDIFRVRDANAIQDVEELRVINGIDKLDTKEWKDLKDRLYYGRGVSIDLALVDEKYLASYLSLSDYDANSLIALRKEDYLRYTRRISHLKQFNDESMGFAISKQVKIEIRVSLKNAKSILKTIIDFKRNRFGLYTIISYQMQ